MYTGPNISPFHIFLVYVTQHFFDSFAPKRTLPYHLVTNSQQNNNKFKGPLSDSSNIAVDFAPDAHLKKSLDS